MNTFKPQQKHKHINFSNIGSSTSKCGKLGPKIYNRKYITKIAAYNPGVNLLLGSTQQGKKDRMIIQYEFNPPVKQLSSEQTENK